MTNALEYEITCCDLYEKNLAAENNKIWEPINVRRTIEDDYIDGL
jgi:hypothetical protein